MALAQVDAELWESALSGRGGAIFHAPTHFICGDPEREQHGRDQRVRYSTLEGQYVSPGGRIPSEEESFQYIAEGYHTSCEKKRGDPAAPWSRFSQPIDRMLDRMQALLARKRALLRKAKPR